MSLHDPDARPIAKGRLGKPVEFGYKAQVTDNVDGIVLDHSMHVGNPADGPLLVPAIRRIAARFGLVPAAVTADRGYGEAKIEAELAEFGVETVAIPRKGKPSKARRDVEQLPSSTAWSSGAPGPKAGSATSSAGSAGTAPCWPPQRRPNLVRPGCLRPQQRQDHRPDRGRHARTTRRRHQPANDPPTPTPRTRRPPDAPGPRLIRPPPRLAARRVA